jgi:hypothetical protein
MSLRHALFLAALLVLSGCKGQQSAEVSGTVTFNGQPVPAGRIYFTPDITKGNDGPQGYAEIHDGKFDTRQGGKGACGGPTVVVIQGYDGKKDQGTMGDPLFKEHRITIDLPREPSSQDFNVPAEAGKDLPKPSQGGRKP